jgi:hypothetical protein
LINAWIETGCGFGLLVAVGVGLGLGRVARFDGDGV